MMIYCCDLGIWPPFFSTVIFCLSFATSALSPTRSFDLTYNHQIMFRRDATGVTEGVRVVRVAQITGDGKEKKREPPSWIFFLHDFSHCRLTRRARKTGPIADRLRTVSRGQHSRTQRRELLISFSSLFFLSPSLLPGTRVVIHFFSHNISAVDDHEWSRPHRRGLFSRDLVILLSNWNFAEVERSPRRTLIS